MKRLSKYGWQWEYEVSECVLVTGRKLSVTNAITGEHIIHNSSQMSALWCMSTGDTLMFVLMFDLLTLLTTIQFLDTEEIS